MRDGDARTYRRGVALGFTLAELFTLLLFLLVLILAAVRQHQRAMNRAVAEEHERLTRDLNHTRETLRALAEKYGDLSRKFGLSNDFKDEFQ